MDRARIEFAEMVDGERIRDTLREPVRSLVVGRTTLEDFDCIMGQFIIAIQLNNKKYRAAS